MDMQRYGVSLRKDEYPEGDLPRSSKIGLLVIGAVIFGGLTVIAIIAAAVARS